MANVNAYHWVAPKGQNPFIALVTEVNGGWTTVVGPEGQQLKLRNGSVGREATSEEASGQTRTDGNSRSTVRPDWNKYTKHKDVRTPSGRVALDNGDTVAAQLRGMDLDRVYAEASKVLNTPEDQLRAKYSHLNPGMQRMNLGNRIRRALNG